jgi:hypothetical protein
VTEQRQPTIAEVVVWARDAGSDDAHQYGPAATFAEYASRLVDAFGLGDGPNDGGLAAETYDDYLVEFQRVTLAART